MSETTHSSQDYAYVDKTAPKPGSVTTDVHKGDREVTQAELNPAYYPASAKPEVMLNEAEKAGSEFPTSDPAAVASGKTSDGEALDAETEAALTGGSPEHVPAGTSPASDGDSGGTEDTGGEEGDEIDQALAGNVEDAKAYAEANPDAVDEMLAREQEGQGRVTLISALEAMQEDSAE